MGKKREKKTYPERRSQRRWDERSGRTSSLRDRLDGCTRKWNFQSTPPETIVDTVVLGLLHIGDSSTSF